MFCSWVVVFFFIPLLLLQCFFKKKAPPPAKKPQVKQTSVSASASERPQKESTTMSQKQPSKEENSVKSKRQSEALKFNMNMDDDDDEPQKTLIPSVEEGENPLMRPDVQRKFRNFQLKNHSNGSKMEGVKQQELRLDGTQEDKTAKPTKPDEGQTEVTVELDRQYQPGAAKKYVPKSAANKKIASPEVKPTPSREKRGPEGPHRTAESTMETMTQMSAPMFTVDKTMTVMMTVTTVKEPPIVVTKEGKKSMEGGVKSGYC